MTDIGAKDIFPFPKKPWPPFSKVLKNMKIILKKQETKTQKVSTLYSDFRLQPTLQVISIK